MYSVRRITEGAWIESFCEWSMWPLCSSTRATPLKIMTTARRSVHTLIGSKEAFRTKTRPVILLNDISGARPRVSKQRMRAEAGGMKISTRQGREQIKNQSFNFVQYFIPHPCN